MLAIVLVAQVVSACCSSRQVSSDQQLRVESLELRDSVKETVMEVVHDTIVETTIITVRENEAGDTISRSVVTDRTRAASRDYIAAYKTKTVVKTDTVFVERRDSVLVQAGSAASARASPLVSGLKWVFFIIIALIGLKICPFFWRERKN